MIRFLPKSVFGLLCLLGLCLFAACRKEDDAPIVHISQEEFSAEDQRIIGLRLKETVLGDEHNYPVLNLENNQAEEELKNYFNSLVNTLAVTSPVLNRNDYDWSITIVEDDEDQNLFATPGGHFFIYTGLLKFIESENELLGILAHEMMYTDQGYLINGLKNFFGSEALGDVLLHNTVADIDNMAAWLRDARFTGDDIVKADSFAVNVMCPFLFDANGLNTFLERTQEEENCSWLNKRSGSADRIEQIAEQVSNCGSNEKIYDVRYQEMVAKLE